MKKKNMYMSYFLEVFMFYFLKSIFKKRKKKLFVVCFEKCVSDGHTWKVKIIFQNLAKQEP
jgi:hypothetical protein